MKVDLYNHKNRWLKWRETYSEEDIPDINKKNSDLIKQYVFDMEKGENVSISNRKGSRSYSRLNTLKDKMVYLSKLFEKYYNVADLTNLNSSHLADLFTKMRKGEIKSAKGKAFKSTSDYVKIFKAFWHWWMKINRRKKKPEYIQDITEDLDTSYDEKPKWVYLDDSQIDRLLKKANPYYKPLVAFLFDSGARVTETFSLLVEDISQDAKGTVYVNIKDEISKSSGRKIKLMLCGRDTLEYIKENNLKPEDNLFSHSVPLVNDYINSLGKELFGEGNSKAGEKYSNLTMYDFRHNSCCYWIQRYKTNSSLMYRFGWKSEKYVHYYSEFLGMKDPIRQEDMYVDITKTELEKEISKLKSENISQEEGLTKLATENKKIWKLLNRIAVMNKITYEATAKNKDVEAEFKKAIKRMMSRGESIYPLNESV